MKTLLMEELGKIFAPIDTCTFSNLQNSLCSWSHFHGTTLYEKGFFTPWCLLKMPKASLALKFAPFFFFFFGQGEGREVQGKVAITGGGTGVEE